MDETLVENFENVWDITVDVWKNGFYGIDISNIIVALAILFAFMVFRGILSKYILTRLQDWAKNTKTRIDDKIVEALIPPVKFIPVILGIFFSTQYLDQGQGLDSFFQSVTRSLIAFTIFWALYRTLSPISHAASPLKRLLTPLMMQWLYRFLRVLIVMMGGAVILEIWGIEIAPLLAGLGLFGAAVALGAQDLFKNLIGGVTVIAEKRFNPGDWILVDGVVEGVVEDIGFRSTRVRRFDKAPVHVPNAQLSDAAVTNFSRMTHRRIYWKIGVTYSTTIDQLKIIRDEITAYIQSDDSFASPEDVSTFVRVDSFNASSIDILVYCFTKTTVWGEWLEVKENFAFAIKDIVENKAGSSFAFPSQSLYIESLPGDAPEIFIPPKE